MVPYHGIFQGCYLLHHIGMDRDIRIQFRDHPCFAQTEEICARFDAPAFDPEAETLPIEFFEPMLRRVFAQPRNSMCKNGSE